MEAPFLSVKNINKSFAGVHALKNINLDIAPGEIHCLAGENGSGKSTLIKVISGVHTPESGTIDIAGHTWNSLTPLEAIDAGIQVIYQDFSVFPNLTVMENLALTTEVAAGHRWVNWKRFRRIAEEAVAKIGFAVDLDATVADLSVADKQLVAICRALMSDAKLIIMDEPTTALTKREVASLFKIILDLQARGIAILFVSHKLEEVFEISERFTILRSGEKVITCHRDELDRHKFAQYMTGRDFEEVRFQADASTMTTDPVLSVKNLSVTNAFTDVSFDLHAGEILGITGLLGSGRTELALALFGAIRADSGTITVKGTDVTLRRITDAIDAGIAYVPEDRLTEGLFLSRSIGENIVISQMSDFTRTLGVMDRQRIDEAQKRWVKELDVATPDPDNAVNTLSGGNQQKVVLAKWLATGPDVLILNGPTVGVDIGSKFTIHSILRNLAAEGMAIIIISDDIAEVLTNCSSVWIMRGGKLRESVDPATTTEKELAELMARDTAEIDAGERERPQAAPETKGVA
ncbi:sugar ABC transporter ATP-binding protein [Schaalia sp. ZJ405]|uniref:sugar ABC transporter ATP-binding protein n=1 Tax=unclassified Schaalia TaxID=2691889 RepID=UPI0013ED7A8E|nr:MULTISPECIES: sugar ABC transporter ATP-binding protein [unclassified Schaalia]QPK81310.1 sugar ABC transporter ATP-binding protein [Schaalia sp. ZJ405]